MQSRRMVLAFLAVGLVGCGRGRSRAEPVSQAATPLYPNETPELRRLIEKYAAFYDLPVGLVHQLAVRESTHNPAARNGPYYGLLQISVPTARSMGFKGQPSDLLNAETNLTYAGKYLRGAWLLADGSFDEAVKWYSRGYYFEAKRRGLLKETGLVK